MKINLPQRLIPQGLGICLLLLLLGQIFFKETGYFTYVLGAALLFVPGLLALHLFDLSFSSKLEKLFHSVSISVGLAMFLTVILSSIKQYWYYSLSLNVHTIAIAYFILVVILFIPRLIWPVKNILKYSISIDIRYFVVSVLFLLLPIVSIFSTTYLNNTGEGKYVVYLYLFIIASLSALAILYKKVSPNLVAVILYFVTLSIIFTYTFRSQFISGFDIHTENLVYKQTEAKGYWSTLTSNPVYNSCLSVTALPFIINEVTGLSNEVMLKVLFPILFSLVPVALYLYLLKVFDNSLPILSSIYFIIQKQLSQQMPALSRQEVGFIFFSSVLLILFKKTLKKSDWVLLTFYLACLVVSHYSTAYITLGLFVISWLLKLVYPSCVRLLDSLLFVPTRKFVLLHAHSMIKSKITVNVIVVLAIFITLWVGVINRSYQNVESISTRTANSVNLIFSTDFQNTAMHGILARNYSVALPSNQEFNAYFINQYTIQKGGIIHYPDWITSAYPISVADATIKPIINKSNYVVLNKVNGLIILTAKLLPFVGGLVLVIFFLAMKKKVSSDYVLMSLASLAMLIVFIILPFSGTGYNIERLFQQLLFFLAPLTLIPLLKLSKYGLRYELLLPLLFVVLYAVSDGGLGVMSYYTGGSSNFNFNNFGDDYQKFYTHQAEITSLNWLSTYKHPSEKVFMDQYAQLKAISYTDLNTFQLLKDTAPILIGMNNYVYASEMNANPGITYLTYNGSAIRTKYPTPFLTQNKNTIYSTQSTVIYK